MNKYVIELWMFFITRSDGKRLKFKEVLVYSLIYYYCHHKDHKNCYKGTLAFLGELCNINHRVCDQHVRTLIETGAIHRSSCKRAREVFSYTLDLKWIEKAKRNYYRFTQCRNTFVYRKDQDQDQNMYLFSN